ncbi:MAG: 50S ribosomal protein L10 [Bacteroidales bacterium]|nr:50S ribosomal protein L10 [Candidatus Cacconaster merdequi]
MRKEEKTQIIESIAAQVSENPNFYLADVSGLNAENTSALRRACFEKGVKMIVVKNTLLKRAIDQVGNQSMTELYPTLAGSTAIMFTTAPSAPAKIIKELGAKFGKPELKSAYLQECTYVGAENLATLVNIKSREEMIGDIVGLLQSPIRRVISALENAKKEDVAE